MLLLIFLFILLTPGFPIKLGMTKEGAYSWIPNQVGNDKEKKGNDKK